MPLEGERVFGLPAWVALLALGGAGVVGYLLFFKNSGSSSGGGATGYSAQGLAVMQNPDESATMALQNELLSQIGGQIDTGFSGVGDQLTEIGGNVTTGFSSVGTSLNGISGQLGGIGGQLGGIADTQKAQGAANQAYYNALLQNLTNYANSISQQLSDQQRTTLAQLQQNAQTEAQQFQNLQGSDTAQYNALYNLGVYLNNAMGQQFGGINQQLAKIQSR